MVWVISVSWLCRIFSINISFFTFFVSRTPKLCIGFLTEIYISIIIQPVSCLFSCFNPKFWTPRLKLHQQVLQIPQQTLKTSLLHWICFQMNEIGQFVAIQHYTVFWPNSLHQQIPVVVIQSITHSRYWRNMEQIRHRNAAEEIVAVCQTVMIPSIPNSIEVDRSAPLRRLSSTTCMVLSTVTLL